MKRTRLKAISKKQAKRKREVDKIKHTFSESCCLCGAPAVDGAHLLPKSIFPEYYHEPWSIVPMCRYHHTLYDNSKEFRHSCTELANIVRQHDEKAAYRYFGL